MEHIPESELAIYAFDPAAVPEERRNAIIAHTAECARCRATRDFFAVAEDDLSDVDVWERSMGSATRESLMAYAARIAEEDEEAEELLKPLFDAPARVAWQNLGRQKRFLTGGVVRRLNAHAHSICESEPLDALTFAEAAIVVAEALPDDTYPAKAVYELRATAWEERASAQRVLGQCAEALDSLTRAERAYKRLTSPSLGLAKIAFVRSSVLYQQQRLDEAAAMAQRAEQAFAHLGDDERRMSALYLRGGIKYEARSLSDALALFCQVVEYGEAMNNSRWIARGSNALGYCEVQRANLGEASMHFHKALALLPEIGAANERLSAEWGVATVLLQAGKRSEAIRRLRDVAAEFEARGMITDAALVRLDIADALLALGEVQQIVKLASTLFSLHGSRDAHRCVDGTRLRERGGRRGNAHARRPAGCPRFSTASGTPAGPSLRSTTSEKSLRLSIPWSPSSARVPSNSPATRWPGRVYATFVFMSTARRSHARGLCPASRAPCRIRG